MTLTTERSLTPTITVETAVDPDTALAFYELYRASFGHLEVLAAARQLFHREEFLAEMYDPRVHKYVAWDADGRAVGMSTLTSHLETVPWISPAYFAHHYPDHTARGAVYYLGFTLVDPAYRRTRLFEAMVEAVVEVLNAERAVCAWDICGHNDDVLRLGLRIENMLGRRNEVVVETIDRQTYYGATFSGIRRAG